MLIPRSFRAIAFVFSAVLSTVSAAHAATVYAPVTTDASVKFNPSTSAASIIDTDEAAITLTLDDAFDYGAVLLFDLSGVPTGATIHSVTVHLDVTGFDLVDRTDGIEATAFASNATLTDADLDDPFAIMFNAWGLAKPSATGHFQITLDLPPGPAGVTLQEIFDSGASHLGVMFIINYANNLGDYVEIVTSEGAALGNGFAPYLEITYEGGTPVLPTPVVPSPATTGAGAMLLAGLACARCFRRRA